MSLKGKIFYISTDIKEEYIKYLSDIIRQHGGVSILDKINH